MRHWFVTNVALGITLASLSIAALGNTSAPLPSSNLPHTSPPGPLTAQTITKAATAAAGQAPLPSLDLPRTSPPGPLTVQTIQTLAVPKGTSRTTVELHATVMKAGPDVGILCTENIQYPHKSTHVPENVNVVGTLECTAPVSELVLNVGLYYNHVLVSQSGPVTVYGSSYDQATAATACVNGLYGGAAHGYVVFPPGFVGNGQLPVVFSPNVPITC